jgi:protease I
MSENLSGLWVAILVTDGFEQVELLEPRRALNQAGADTSVVSPKRDTVRGWNFTDWGEELPVDVVLDTANAGDFDALLLPGGVMNPDTLRTQPEAVDFVRSFFENGTSRRDLPRTVDHHRSRSGAGATDRLLAFVENRPPECRRGMGG